MPQCVICFEQMQAPCVTDCGHLFHAACIARWMGQSNSCPICRDRLYDPHTIRVSPYDVNDLQALCEEITKELKATKERFPRYLYQRLITKVLPEKWRFGPLRLGDEEKRAALDSVNEITTPDMASDTFKAKILALFSLIE